MPITIKSTGMKYKNPDTGVYQGVDMLEEATIRDVIVDVYSPTSPYSVGEYCLYNGELYCCTTAIPAGGETWNLAHWDKTKVTDELENIKGAVGSIGSDDVANESNVTGTTVSDALGNLSGAINSVYNAGSTTHNDCNNFVKGFVKVAPETANLPEACYGVLWGYVAQNESWKWQILETTQEPPKIFKRENINNGGWTSWVRIADDTDISSLNSAITTTATNVAPMYSTSVSYNVGDYVTRIADGKLYRCISATSGAWNGTKWTEVDAANDLKGAITQDNLSMSLFSTNSARRLANANDAPYGQSSYDPNTTNIPSGGSGYGIIHHYYAMGWIIQIAYDTYGNVYKRRNINSGGWTPWASISDELIIRCDTAIAIPSTGNNVVKTLTGLTSAYELIRWNFSSSAENAPPVNLTWGTYDNGTFVIVNNGGTTSETIKPVFAKALAKTAT